MSDDPTERARAGALAAPVLLGACLLLSLAAVALDVAASGAGPGPVGSAWPTALGGLALALPGALLLHRLPRHPVAWVLALGGLAWCLDAVAAGWTTHALVVDPGAPAGSAAFFLWQRLGAVLLLPLPLVLLLFPDGRFPRRRLLRLPAQLTTAALAAFPVVLAVVPSDVAVRFHGDPLPAGAEALALDPISVDLPWAVWSAVLTGTNLLMVGSMVVPVVVVASRFRRADAERRAQLRWLLAAGLLAAAVMAGSRSQSDDVLNVVLPLAVALVSGAVVVAVTRYRLYDLDLLLGWTLLYAVLAGALVAVDVLVFAVAGSVFSGRSSALVAGFVVALVYGPLRVRLHLLVRRLVRGRRDEPWEVVSALAERLEDSSDADAQLSALVGSVAAAFGSRYVRVELERHGAGTVVVEHGTPVPGAISLPVVYRGRSIGRLVLAPPRGARLSDADQRLLADVVRQGAAAHRTAQLAEQLQASREALVTAREEERRRLRRDLHDGLGPALGAVSLRIETARLLPDRPAADALLAAAVSDVRGVLDDVRRLVHDLRPPALDEVGLAGALEQQAERLRRDGAGGLDVTLTADGDLAALPAAVEVAAYRIVSEALANVVRHADARSAQVRLSCGPVLVVEVVDDGGGIEEGAAAGVGLVSLRERAAELGGTVSVTCPPGGGTHVRAELPVVRVPAQGDARTLSVTA